MHDDSGTVSLMRFSNDNIIWSDWEAYATSKNWTLSEGSGLKTIYVQFSDADSNISAVYSDTIELKASTPAEVGAIIEELVVNGAIADVGVADALIASLNNAQEQIEKNPIAAKNMLTATIKKLEAQAGKKVNVDAANELIGYLNDIIARL